MNSPFQNKFISKSPLRKHKGLQRKLKKAKAGKIGAEGQGGIDYELISNLQEKIKDAEAAHTTKRTEEGDTQVREDEEAAQGSAVEMKSSPLHGYAAGSDIQASHYRPTAHLWQNAINSIVGGTVSHIKAKTKIKLDQAAEDKLKKRQADWNEKVSKPPFDSLSPGDPVYDQAYYEAFPELITKKAKQPK